MQNISKNAEVATTYSNTPKWRRHQKEKKRLGYILQLRILAVNVRADRQY